MAKQQQQKQQQQQQGQDQPHQLQQDTTIQSKHDHWFLDFVRNPNLFRNSKQNVLGWICTMNMYLQQQQQQHEQHGQDEPHQYQH
jgi:hypothetical protein